MSKLTDIERYLLAMEIFIISSMGLLLGWFWKKLPPELPWFYSLPWGEQQLTTKGFVAVIIATTFAVSVLTKFIAGWAGKEDETVKNTVTTGGLIFVILIAATFFRVLKIFVGS